MIPNFLEFVITENQIIIYLVVCNGNTLGIEPKEEVMNQQQIKSILKECEFKLFDIPFDFFVMKKGDGFLLQLNGFIKDNETDKFSWQKGGKHYVSSHAIKDEIVNKAWKACFDFVIHEAREAFYFKGETIYHPHFLVDELANFVSKSKHAKRDEEELIA